MSTISGYLDPIRLADLANDPDYVPARRTPVVIPLRRNPVQSEAAATALAALRVAQANYRKTVPAPVALRRNWAAEIVEMAESLSYCADSTAFDAIKREVGRTVELAETDWYSDGWDACLLESGRGAA